MRAPLEWIREYVTLPPSVTVADVVAAYTRIGLEVEAVHSVPPTQGPLIVGRVLDIEELTGFKKPIRFVHLDLGPTHGAEQPDGTVGPRGIICGARNFAVGDAVIVALPGTVLPGGFTIAARKTYGHLSDGMICSARELGIGADHDGIVVLDADAEIGTDARALIGSGGDDGAVIEFAITPDRGYTLSIRGLARELAAAYDAPYIDPAERPVAAAGAGRPVEIVDAARCTRFVAAEATHVDPAAVTPWRMRRRLLGAGIRTISLAVDVTNYVMLELGQPLHAFDAAKLDGGIVVRRARPGETLRTLDGADRVLSDDDVVVADASRAVSLAGVMGGEETEISDATTDVVIEAATWDPPSISRTVRRHRLPSEAARRFERAVDPAVALAAADAAVALLVSVGGGEPAGRTDAGSVARPVPVVMAVSEPERLAGRPFTRQACTHRLEQVGCEVSSQGSADAPELRVTPPTWRPDLTRAADLVEEIARLEGYDTIEPVLPAAPAGTGLTVAQRRRRRVAADLAAAGLTEVISFPFMGAKDLDSLGIPADDPRRRATRLANPLDADRPLMQTTLLPGLVATATRNLARGARDLALFEIGQVVRPAAGVGRPPAPGVDHRPSDGDLAALRAAVPPQPVRVAVLLAGHWERAGWWGPGRDADTTDIVALAGRIAAACGGRVAFSADEHAPWHPGRCAAVTVDGRIVGHAGELHPAAIDRLGLPARALALEIDLGAFPVPPPPVPPVVSAFPPVHLDVALVVGDGVPAGSVTAALRDGGGPLLESVRLFDVYTGDQAGAGHKSLAFALTVRAADRTLTAAEALTVRDAAVARAGEVAGAVLRA